MVAHTQVRTDSSDGIPIITAIGEIDIATAPLLLERFDDVPTGSSKVVVDLSDVTFLDSTGLGVLIAGEKRLGEGSRVGRMHLVISRPEILKLFEITGLTGVFLIAPTLEEALAGI